MVVAPLHFRTGQAACFLDNSCLRAVKQTTLQGQAAFKSGTLFKSLFGKTWVTGVVHGDWEWILIKKKSRNNQGSLIGTVMEGSNITSFIISIIIPQFVGRLPWAYLHPPLGNVGNFSPPGF